MTVVEDRALPPLLGDFYGYEKLLSEDDQQVLLLTRDFLEPEVRPIANDHWGRRSFRITSYRASPTSALSGSPTAPDRPPASRLLTGLLATQPATSTRGWRPSSASTADAQWAASCCADPTSNSSANCPTCSRCARSAPSP